MADPIVHVTNGIPDAGTGNITTLGQTLIDGANFTLGSSTDLAVAAGAVGTLSAKLRSISRDLVGGIVLQPGANVIGAVTQSGGPWSISGTVGVSGTVTVSGTIAATQSGTWNINNISGTITLPTGAATAAKQPALGVAGTPSTDVLTVQGAVGMTVLKVDGSAVTQPISGSVGITGNVNAVQSGTWNVGITGTVSVVQGGNFTTRIVGNTGNTVDFLSTQNATTPGAAILIGGEFNTVPTTITNGNSSPLQLDSSANLLVNVKASVLPSGAATSANQSSAAGQGSATAGQTGVLGMGAVTTAAPSYTTTQTSPLSLDTSGNLRVVLSGGAGTGTSSSFGSIFPTAGTAAGAKDNSGNMAALNVTAGGLLKVDGSGVTQPVSGTFWQTTQPVSGTVTSNQGGAPWTVKPDGTVWALSGTSANVNLTNASVAVTGTFWQSTQPISAVSLPLPSGAATSANQPTAATLGSTTSGQTGNLALGAVTTGAPSYTTGQSQALSLTTSGALRVDGSGVTQPVSGTFWQATQPVSGAVTVSQSTAANLNATVTGTISANQSGTWTTRIVGNAGAVIDGVIGAAAAPANMIVTGGVFNTSPPALTTGQSSAVQLDSSGNLCVNIKAGAGSGGTASTFGSAFPGQGTAIGVKDSAGTNMTFLQVNASNALKVDGSAVTQPVSGTFWQATQPVSGTFWQATQPVSIAAAVTVQQATAANLNATVTGTVAATQSGTWNITNVSGTVSLPTGAATSANQPSNIAQAASTASQTGNLAMGLVTTGNPSYTTGTINGISLDTSGAVRVNVIAGSGGGGTSSTFGSAFPSTGTAIGAKDSTGTNMAALNLDGGGNLKVVQTSPAWQQTGAAWTSATGLNTAITLVNAGGAIENYVIGTITQTTTITAGAITFEETWDQGTSWKTVPASRVIDPSTGALLANPYTLVANAVQAYQIIIAGADQIRARLSTVITGTGSATIKYSQGQQSGTSSVNVANPSIAVTGTFWQATQPVSIAAAVTVSQATAANLNATVTGTVAATQSGNWTSRIVGNAGATLDVAASQNVAMPTNILITGGEFNTTPTTIASGNCSPLQLDANGNLLVNVKAGGGAGGTSSSFGTTFPGTGTAAGAQYLSSPPALTSGQMNGLLLDVNGNLKTAATQVGTWNIGSVASITNPVPICGDTGVALDFNGQNAVATINTMSVGGQFNTSPTVITSGRWSPLQLDANGSLLVNLKTSIVQSNQGDTASGATDAGNPLKLGGLAKTTNPTAVSDGQRVNGIFDKVGKQIAVGAIRQLKGIQTTSITVSTETTIVTAGAAGVFNDLYGLTLTNSSAAVALVAIKDGTAGTTRFTFEVPANDTRGFMLPVDSAVVQSAAAANWTATVTPATTTMFVTALYVGNI